MVRKVPARAAAKVVLLRAGRPMHYREIAQVAVEMGIVRVRGNPLAQPNPDATMKTIRSYLCERTQDGRESEFVRVDAGVYDLRSRPAAIAAAKMSGKSKGRTT